MASSAKGRVRLRGRFSPGTPVQLIRVDGPHVLRVPDGASIIRSKDVDTSGCVEFLEGVVPGDRYFIRGLQAGQPLEVRAIGRTLDDTDGLNDVAPVAYDRPRLSDGSWLDEAPEQHQEQATPAGAVALGQHQVPAGVWQRSDTPRGSAEPITPAEHAAATSKKEEK